MGRELGAAMPRGRFEGAQRCQWRVMDELIFQQCKKLIVCLS